MYMRFTKQPGLWTGALIALAASVHAVDWPQWRGPLRNGISAEVGWFSGWGNGPRRRWAVEVGEGFSAVAVVGLRVFTLGNAGGKDTIYCLNADTGKPIWTHSYPCSPGDYGGTRATPTVSGGRVFTLSREGHAFCLDVGTGAVVWQKNLARELGAQVPTWGFAGSPLVEGGAVVYNVGAAGAALDRTTGRTLWKSGPGPAGYASPIAYDMAGRRVVALFAGTAMLGVDPKNGAVVWRHPWNTSYDVNAADPVFAGTDVFLSSNYDRGCALLRPGSGRAQVVWQNKSMRNHFSSTVLVNGALYGNDQNTLKCLDLRTGAERWQMRGMGKGGLIAADNKLIVLTERGELLVVSATPAKYTELARMKVLDGTCWTHPVLANGALYCRSHEGRLVRMDLRTK